MSTIVGSDKLAHNSLRDPGEVLTARDGTQYKVQDNGAIYRTDRRRQNRKTRRRDAGAPRVSRVPKKGPGRTGHQ